MGCWTQGHWKMQFHLASLQFNWKVKHDEAEHTQNNLEGTDENSAVPEGATKRKLFLISAWKLCCNILDVNSSWTSIDFIPFHRPTFSLSSSRFSAPSLEIFDATCIFNPGIIFSEVKPGSDAVF